MGQVSRFSDGLLEPVRKPEDLAYLIHAEASRSRARISEGALTPALRRRHRQAPLPKGEGPSSGGNCGAKRPLGGCAEAASVIDSARPTAAPPGDRRRARALAVAARTTSGRDQVSPVSPECREGLTSPIFCRKRRAWSSRSMAVTTRPTLAAIASATHGCGLPGCACCVCPTDWCCRTSTRRSRAHPPRHPGSVIAPLPPGEGLALEATAARG